MLGMSTSDYFPEPASQVPKDAAALQYFCVLAIGEAFANRRVQLRFLYVWI